MNPPGQPTPRVATARDEFVAGATGRAAVRSPGAKSGARFKRLTIGGEPCFLKLLSSEDHWIRRVTGNTTYWEFKAAQDDLGAERVAVRDAAKSPRRHRSRPTAD